MQAVYSPVSALGCVMCRGSGLTASAALLSGTRCSAQVGLNVAPGNPVTSCRLNSKFAFCVMRTPEEAAKALNLNGIPYLGNVLKLVSLLLVPILDAS